MRASSPKKQWDPAFFYVPFLLPFTFLWDSLVHEGGHAVACILEGHKVTNMHILIPAYTQCSCYTAMFYAAGTITSLVVWAASTVILTRSLLPRLRGYKWVLFIEAWWVDWSVSCLGELVLGAYQVHSYPKMGIVPDTARLAEVAGIHPEVIIAVCLSLFAISTSFVFVPAGVSAFRIVKDRVQASGASRAG